MGVSNEKVKSLLSALDTVFVINGEMIENNGEDSFAFSVNDRMGMVGVFDGCGGIGSRKYPEYGNKSGAYIASRVTSDLVMDWFKKHSEEQEALSEKIIKDMCNNLKGRLGNKLRSMDSGTDSGVILGSLSKSFPTTASIILFSSYKETVYSSFIWAGDSRGFILTEDGLCQITRDDIEGGGDALNNLSADSKLTNFVSAAEDFQLHSKSVLCDSEAILITASDGCFAYFSTPMEFEFMLIESMQRADNVEQWKQNLEAYIKKYTADDYTMGIAVCGYKSFKKLKKAFLQRRNFLFEKYISKLENSGDEMKAALWNEYKKTYYRGV